MSETEDEKKKRILKDYGIEDEKPWGKDIVESEVFVRDFEIFGVHVRVRDFKIFSWTRHSDSLRSDF